MPQIFSGTRGRQSPRLSPTHQGYLTQDVLFKGNFNKVVIGIHKANYTLVPTAFLHQKNLDTFYHFNHLSKAETEIISDEFDVEDMNTVYGVDMHLMALLQGFFGEFTLQHGITFLAKQLLVENRVYNDKRMYVNVEKRNVDIIITEQSMLLFCNSYRYIMPEDFLYFIINAGNQNQVNFATNECILLGDIVHRDPTYQLCNQYITNLSFGNRPIAKKYCSEFNQLSKQHYYNLFSIH